MRFLHMLLAIAFSFRRILAKIAVEELRRLAMFVIDMSVQFLLRWPTMSMVSAIAIRAFPGS
jgi:hypothetical protein